MRDLSVRAALGAGRGRVMRMLLGESALLGALGGALGIALAYGLVELVVRYAPADFPRVTGVQVSGGVLAYAVAATVGATILAGLVPALRSSRVDATASLGGGGRGEGLGRGGCRWGAQGRWKVTPRGRASTPPRGPLQDHRPGNHLVGSAPLPRTDPPCAPSDSVSGRSSRSRPSWPSDPLPSTRRIRPTCRWWRSPPA